MLLLSLDRLTGSKMTIISYDNQKYVMQCAKYGQFIELNYTYMVYIIICIYVCIIAQLY